MLLFHDILIESQAKMSLVSFPCGEIFSYI